MIQLSKAQKQIYEMEQYGQNGVSVLAGSLTSKQYRDIDALEYAVQKMIKVHDALRIRIDESEVEPKQCILDYKPVACRRLEFASKEELADWAKKETLKPLPLNGDLVQIDLITGTDFGGWYVKVNHIVADAWTSSLIEFDLVKYYKQYIEGNRSLEEEAFSYLAFIERELANEKKFGYQKAINYWKNQIEETYNCISLANHTSVSNVSQRTVIDWDASFVNQLSEFCNENQISEYVCIMTAIQLYMAMISREDDFYMGTTFLNRLNQQEKQTYGMYVNTLPVPVHIKDDDSVSDVMKRCKATIFDLMRYQQYNYTDILKNIYEEGKGKLYDVIFNYLNAEFGFDEGSENEEYFCGAQTESLILNFRGTGNGHYVMNYGYHCDAFTEEEIRHMDRYILFLLEQMMSNPEGKVKELKRILPEEEEKIFHDWNHTDADYPKNTTVVELFEEQVRKTPDKVAVVFGDKKITYAELNRRANIVAHRLRKMGVQRDDLVAIVSRRSVEMIVGIYGIIKAGGAYVPVDPIYPKDRIEYILEDSNPKAVLCYQVDVDVKAPILDLRELETFHEREDNPERVNQPQDLIYVIYTSGTTGKPKGVLLEHKNVVRLLRNDQFQFDFHENDVWMMFHSFCFDFSVWEMYGATLNGGTLVVISEEVAKDPSLVAKCIKTNQVTVLNQVPSAFYNLIKQDMEAYESVRYLIFGGEALNPKRLKVFHEKYPNIKIINMYGITETTVHVTYREIAEKEIDKGISDIGRAIPTLQVYMLQGEQLCGVGIPGELCVVGEGLGRGYLKREELTKERFVKAPFSEERMYRSGDLAKWLPDGNIEYMGRIDKQVKIRGFRIELGEIENAIRRIENIQNVAVIVREDASKEKAIHAYVVSEESLSISKIKKELRVHLPEYMVPTYIMQIDQIPLTSNGKLNQHMLPEITAVSEEEYIAPRNSYESVLVDIYKDILNVSKVSALDDFFALGGHSLSVTKVVNQVEERLGVRIKIKDVFEYPIVEELAKRIKEHEQKQEIAQIPQVEKAEYYPITPTQKKFFYYQQLNETETTYNMPAVIQLEQPISKERLTEIFQELCEKNEILRTSFKLVGEEPVQIVHETVTPDIQFTTEVLVSEDKKQVSKFVRPFQLEKAPIMRVVSNGTQILFDMHHIIADGASVNLLVQQFMALYQGQEIQASKVAFKDYCHWLLSKDFSAQKEYWMEQLDADLPVIDLPLDFARPITEDSQGAHVTSVFSKELVDKVQELANELHATAYMILLSSLMILLSKYSRQEDIVVGSPIAGRVMQGTEDIMGPLLHTLPLRGKPEGKKTVREFLHEMKEITLGAYEHQEYPTEALMEDFKIHYDRSRNAFYDIMFVLQDPDAEIHNVAGMTVQPVELSNSKLDITVHCEEVEESYHVFFEYKTKLFRQETIQQMMEQYQFVIEQVLENQEQRISDIKSATATEVEMILHDFNCLDVPYDKKLTIADRFEQMVEMYPDNIAVIDDKQQWTYSKLNDMANRLANKLIELGVGVEDKVVLLMEKRAEVVASILGILKAGAAYVPMDPSYPAERIQYMIDDCKPKVVLVDSVVFSVQKEISSQIPIVNVMEQAIWEGCAKSMIRESRPNHLAYIIYTSGTTGLPKGVEVENQGVINLVEDIKRAFDIKPNDRLAFFANLVFDASVFELFSAILNGATTVIIPKHIIEDIARFMDYLKQKQISIAVLPPNYAVQLPEIQLKVLMTAGSEALPEVMEKCSGNTKFLNGYGPTESTVCACYWSPNDKEEISGRLPIGRPLQNVQIYIMDGENLCGIGVPGELCIAGDGVARGYLNKEELTNQKFVYNPFGKGKLYRSGDLARWLPNGEIEYLGRIDEQVKIRGFRIELGEIEEAIRTQNNVKEVTVIVRQKEQGEKHLCAYVVSDEVVAFDEMKNKLRERLPEYMIPAFFAQLDEIPVNKSGKVDKKALPEIEAQATSQYVEPETEEERILCQVFESVLSVSKVGIYDNFFELGGDSIKAIQMVSRVREQGYELSVKDIIAEHLVGRIVKKMKPLEANTYEQGDVSGNIRKTPIFHEFEEWKLVVPEHFNQSVMLYSKKNVEDTAVKAAVDKLVTHHDVLRLVQSEEGYRIRSASDGAMYSFESYDLAGCRTEEEQILEYNQALQRNMNLTDGPLVQVACYHTSRGTHIMFAIHHLVVDAVSWNIILEDFVSGYEQYIERGTIELPKKTASYLDYGNALYDYSKSNRIQKEIPYWQEIAKLGKEILEENSLSPLFAPERQEEKAAKARVYSVCFDEEKTAQFLHHSVESYHCEPQELLLAIVGLAVKYWSGMKQVAIMIEGHGREELEEPIKIDRTVGWFTCNYPIVLKEKADLGEYLIETKEAIRKVPNHGIGYGIVKHYVDSSISVKTAFGFNYFGELKDELASEANFERSNHKTGDDIDTTNVVGSKVSMNFSVKKNQLEGYITIQGFELEREEALKQCLVQAMNEVMEHCMGLTESIETASDYNDELSSDVFDEIMDMF